MELRDYESLPDIFEEYPDKEVILSLTNKDNKILDNEAWEGWTKIKQFNILSKGKLIICVKDLSTEGRICKNMGFRFYWGYPIQSFYDLNAAIGMGVEFVRLDAPLFFEMDKVKAKGIKVIAVPNVAYLNYLPRENGVFGTWIRPEDMSLYDGYIDTIMFEDCDMKKEQTLYDIYAVKHEWPGDLSMLITNFKKDAVNRLIYPEEMTKIRMNCGQRCQAGGSCRVCSRTMDLANKELLSAYRDFAQGHSSNE